MRFKLFLVTMFCFLSVNLIFSQQDESREQKKKEFENFKAKRAEYIASEMNLTQEEAKVFWPLCDELQEKKFQLNRALRKEIRTIVKAEKGGQKVSEADYSKIIDLNASTKVEEAELDKSYLEKFKKILPAEKIFKYQRAELLFARKMLDRPDGANREGRGKKEGKE